MSESGKRCPRALTARTARAALLCGGLILAGSGAARAQVFFDGDILPPRVVAWRLSERGFSGLTRPRFDGRVYVVEAVSPAGAPVRLFLDPADGTIVGRQRLGAPETYAGLERPIGRPRPGFGWTEDDAGPRRGGPLPPEADPMPRPSRGPGADAVRSPEGNPYGLNPSAAGRPEAPRKLARTNPVRQPDPKPAARTSPEAPAPTVAPEAARTEPKTAPAASGTPAPADAEPKDSAKKAEPAEGARAEAKPAKPDWKDPPPDGKRPVRVIDGATVVPGTADKDAAP